MATALNGGRLTKERAEIEELSENLVFELVDMADLTEHLEAIAQEAANDVAAAAARLTQARNRHARITEQITELRQHLHSDRMAVVEFMTRNGMRHHIRPEVAACADGALLALAKRREQA